MKRKYVSVDQNIIGSYLGDDVYTHGGNMIVPADTLINDYIIRKLEEFRIEKVYIYPTNTIYGDDYINNDKINNEQRKYIESVNTAKMMLQELAAGRKLDFAKAESVSEHIYSKINDCNSLMDCVNSIRIADEYTYSHLVNVSAYAMLIGKWLGFKKKQIKDVIMAGLLHDVGKSQIPSEILNKRGPLNDLEFEIMKRHTVYGYEIVKDNNDISMDVKRAVIMHHEKEDGSGYPFGIKGGQKNLYSKILTIADIFDAITSERVYRGRQTPFVAFKELEKIGFDTVDPRVVMVLFTNMPRYYVGSRVKMDSGEIGEVVYVPNQCAYAPVVKVNEEYYDFYKEKDMMISEFL